MSWLVTPAVDHVIDKIDVAPMASIVGLIRIQALLAADRRVASAVKRPQVAIKCVPARSGLLVCGPHFAANKCSVTVRALGMERVVQALGNDRILHRDVARQCDGQRFVHSPRGRDVVEDHAIRTADVEAVGRTGVEILIAIAGGRGAGGCGIFWHPRVEVAGANTKVANHDVLRIRDFNGVTPHGDAARRGLSGDRQVAFVNFQSAVQLDRAADVEHDRSRAFGRANRMSQAAWDFCLTFIFVVIGKVDDVVNIAAATADCRGPLPDRSRKCDRPLRAVGAERNVVAGGNCHGNHRSGCEIMPLINLEIPINSHSANFPDEDPKRSHGGRSTGLLSLRASVITKWWATSERMRELSNPICSRERGA